MYLVLCTYGPDALSVRDAAMGDHLSYLRENRDRLRFAGPLLDQDGHTASGSLAIVDTDIRAHAQDYIVNEAFYRAGMFDGVEIIRFDSAIGLRQVNLKVEPEQLYMCRWLTASGVPSGRAPAPESAALCPELERGALLSDDGTHVIGGLHILATSDREHAESVVASDVERWGVDDASCFVSRWRFGQALSAVDGR